MNDDIPLKRKKLTDEFDLSYDEWEYLINQYIFNKEHRAILKASLLDEETYESIAETFNCSRDKVARLAPKLRDKIASKIKKH